MRKLFALMVLTAGMGTMVLSDLPYADAQEKKEAPKKEAPKKEAPKKEAPKKEAPKKEAPSKEESMDLGTIEVYKAKDGFRFRIKDTDGKVAAMPVKGVETEAEALKALEAIKATLNKVKPTIVKE